MQNKFPTVSIILSTYNGAERIKYAIESVQQQVYVQWELIVIDDGSTDTTARVIAGYTATDSRITYTKNEHNLGLQKSLNKGIALANGKYIARIDDDDVWNDAEKLQAQVLFLEQNQDHVLVGTGAIMLDEKGKEVARYILPQLDATIRKKMLRKNCFAHASILMRRDIVLKVGNYNESSKVQHVEDHDLWLRLGIEGKCANISKYMTTLTVSSKSITAKHRVVQAKRMMQLCISYRKKYPSFLWGLVVCLVRLCFFAVVSVVPIPHVLLYRIQAIQRSV